MARQLVEDRRDALAIDVEGILFGLFPALEQAVVKRAIPFRLDVLVAMLHYPPVYAGLGETAFVPLLVSAGVRACAYGHLHSGDHKYAFSGERDGIVYYFVAGDAVDFRPVEIDLAGPR